MSESNHFPSESNRQLDEVLEPYFTQYYRQKCYPGLLFYQGKRQMVQINVPADDLPTLLQAKPSRDNDPDSGKNRPEVKGHVEEVKEYIRERVTKDKPWILGTLTANVSSQEIKLIELGRGICLVVIPRGVKLDITDGQHRKRAIHELIESSEGELIGDNDFPITLVLEDDLRQCQIDFRDMAQTRQLDKSLLLSFGEFEGRVGITKNLQNEVKIFQNKTDKVKSSPATKQKLIYTTNYIARFVSCVFSNDPSHELKDIDVESTSQVLIVCLNQFFFECTHTRLIFEKSLEDLAVDEVARFKEDCILGRSVGLEILGRLLHEIYDPEINDFDSFKVSALAQLDWSRNSSLWDGNVVLRNNNLQSSTKSYKILSNANAIRVAINNAKVRLGWN